MRARLIITLLCAGFLLLCQAGAAAKVGVVAVDALYRSTDAEPMYRIVQGLGYDAEYIREDILSDSSRLKDYKCIILTERHSNLYEEEYEALAEYVREGGTLLITKTAARRMAENRENRLKSPIRNIWDGGPLKEAAGAGVSHAPGIVKKFRVVERNRYTEGLPDEFTYETRPAYDMHDSGARRYTQVYPLEPSGADTLIESVAFYEERNPDTGESAYNMEKPVTHAFMTVNSYGDGQVIRLACWARILILGMQEGRILRIIRNVLSQSGG